METGHHAQRSSAARVVLAGGSGFLGRRLTTHLREQGYVVTILRRSTPTPDELRDGVDHVTWDNATIGEWARALDGARALVNVVGRSVDCRKTPAQRREILTSRVDSCRVLGQALRTVANPPPVWVQSATAHIVGDPIPEDTLCDDTTPPGEGLAPDIGIAWERAFHEGLLPGQRGIALRISFVLGRGGGALARLAKLTRLGLGGTVGHGRQWISWLHELDLVRLVQTAIEDDRYRGVVMATAPHPVTNREFMRALRKACHRPWSPPAPAFAVRLASRFLLDTDPELALLGRRCVPRRLVDEFGFRFAFEQVDAALADLLG